MARTLPDGFAFERGFLETMRAPDQPRLPARAGGERNDAVDYRRMPADQSDRCTLHASKAIRVSVTEMQALTREFREIAARHQGRYDGWAAAGMTRPSGR